MPITNVIQNASETIIGVIEIATNAEILAGTDDAKAASPLKVKQYNDAKNLGVVQTWQDVTGSRAAATTYTNSTGRPIQVAIYAGAASGGTITLTIAGLQVGQHTNGTAVNNTGQVVGIVPIGATYSITLSSWTLTAWRELR
jgi:hypothetical protein